MNEQTKQKSNLSKYSSTFTLCTLDSYLNTRNAGHMVNTSDPSIYKMQGEVDLYELEASLVYTETSRAAKVTSNTCFY